MHRRPTRRRRAALGFLAASAALLALAPAGVAQPSFGGTTTFPAGESPRAVAVGDFDKDLRSDLAVANAASDDLSVLLGRSGGGFGEASDFPVGPDGPPPRHAPQAVVVGDFNGDSDQDVAVANPLSHSISVLLGGAGGSFGEATLLPVGRSPASIAAGDFNGDSDQDLVVANAGSDDVSVLLGAAGGGFGPAIDFPVGRVPSSVVVGNFNRDLDPDIAVANSASGDVSVLLGRGGGSFGDAANYPAGDFPSGIAVGDFNADSHPDLAVPSLSSGGVAVLLGGAGGRFGQGRAVPLGRGRRSIAITDFNEDSDPDLVVANPPSHLVSVLLGGPGDSFGQPTNFRTGGEFPASVAVGDFDRDSRPDLALANSASDDVSVLRSGTGPASAAVRSDGAIQQTALTEQAGGDVVGHHRIAIASAAAFPSYSVTAARQQYVVLNAWQQDRLRALKEANPSVKVLVYKNLAFMNETVGPGGFSSSGVLYEDADKNHPEWFLKNTSGQRFTSWSYPYLWASDIGNPDYQQRFADNVVSELGSQGWDGVFVDDVNPTIKYHYEPSQVALYPSDSAYSQATRSAVAKIGPQVTAAGKLAVANIGAWGENDAYHKTGIEWLQFLSGALDEFFQKWGESAGKGYMPERLPRQLEAIRAAERQGRVFLGITHSARTDVQAARYGFAGMLLAGEGSSHFALHQDYSDETWFPEYDYELGSPTGAETIDSSGVRRRRFERGLVLLNPTSSRHKVSFGGTYSGSGLTNATGATMPSLTGLVLTEGAGGPPPGGTTTSFEAETMTLPAGASVFADPLASGGQAVVFNSNGTATTQHATSGARRMTIRARSDLCSGGAHMVVRVDGAEVLSQTAASDWSDYSAAVTLSDSVHAVSVSFDNDSVKRNCDRNLRVDKVTFSPT